MKLILKRRCHDCNGTGKLYGGPCYPCKAKGYYTVISLNENIIYCEKEGHKRDFDLKKIILNEMDVDLKEFRRLETMYKVDVCDMDGKIRYGNMKISEVMQLDRPSHINLNSEKPTEIVSD